MPFVDRLKDFPIVLEIVPPHRRASEKALETFVARVRQAVKAIPHLDAVNLPEVVDENHVGRPFRRNLDPRDCVRLINSHLGVDIIVNKVIVHLAGTQAVESWVRESIDGHGLRNVVLVGGTSSRNRYPGPSVAEGNAAFFTATQGRRDVTCGNITIADRAGEVGRLLEKTRTGCQFFTSQVLVEPEPMASVLREYGEACAAEALQPATVLLSFAPVKDYDDVEFLTWLGANITEETEDALVGDGSTGGLASLAVARSIFDRISGTLAASRHPVPLGVNVEEISLHNFDLAVKMATEVPSWRPRDLARKG